MKNHVMEELRILALIKMEEKINTYRTAQL